MRSVIEMIRNEIYWEILVPIRDGITHDGRAVAVSYNQSDLPSGRDLVRISYGRNISDIRGLIRESVSYWSIDESGSVGRTGQSLGKAITYSAVTQLGDVDYDSLFEGIPTVRDKRGHEEVHYMDLRMNHQAELSELVDRVAGAPFLVLSLPEMKLKPDERKRWVRPKNAFYGFRAVQRLVRAIEEIDWSDSIIVTFDQTCDIGDGFLEVLWSDRMIVQMHESYLSRLFQISDLAASVTGNAINYPNDLNTELFWKFYRISVNKSARGLVTTAPSDGEADKHTKSSNYKNKSQRSKPIRGLTTTAPSDGGIGKSHTSNRPKIIPIKRRFGRLFR